MEKEKSVSPKTVTDKTADEGEIRPDRPDRVRKKITKRDVLFIVFVILISAAVVWGVVYLTGRTKKVIEPKTLEAKLKELDFHVTDVPKKNINNPNITRAFISHGPDFLLEFYVMNSKENAKIWFDTAVKNKEQDLKDAGTFTVSGKIKNGENYTKYVLDDDHSYIVIVRVEDTCLVVDTGSENKSAVKSVIGKLGY